MDPVDVVHAQALRHRAFHRSEGRDKDPFDDLCEHFLIETLADGRLVGCFRILDLTDGRQIRQSYSAQFYDLSRLQGFPGRIVEMGRFCVAPELLDADILRVGWGALTRYVDARQVELLMGCTSFAGVDPGAYEAAFAHLHQCHRAPQAWAPARRADEVCDFTGLSGANPSTGEALRRMPPLLRTYLAMGGWVSDHAVIDRHMNTLHVFTGLEINAIPAPRQKALRAIAKALDS